MIQSILRDVIGKRLERAIATYHVYQEQYAKDPMAVWLSFHGARQWRFAGASDGWHLTVDDLTAQEIDMQESGSVRIRDIGTVPVLSEAMNQCVRYGWVVTSPSPDDVIGVRFDFDTATVRVLNWGDELYIGPGFPSDADPESISEQPIY